MSLNAFYKKNINLVRLLHLKFIYVTHNTIRVQLLFTGWTVRGSNPGRGWDFPHPSRQTLGPIQPPIQWVPGLSRCKAAGAWRWPPTPTSAKVKERVELTSTPTLRLRDLLQGQLHCTIRLTKPFIYRNSQFCGVLLRRNVTDILCFFKCTAYIMLKIFYKVVKNISCGWIVRQCRISPNK